jgi:uncharacterized protein YdhG (YjbR/CyaY superfamily)
MVSSRAETVEEYLEELPPERREVIAAVRDEILRNLPPGYREAMNWGMISYEIPLERYPQTYNGQPLTLASLNAQKHHYAVYLMSVYMQPDGVSRLRTGFEKAGKKLDIGKSCLRFSKLEDVALAEIGRVIAESPVDQFIRHVEESRRR